MFLVNCGIWPSLEKKSPRPTSLSVTTFGSYCTWIGAETTSVAFSMISATVMAEPTVVFTTGGRKRTLAGPVTLPVSAGVDGAAGAVGGGVTGAVSGGAVAGGAVAGGTAAPVRSGGAVAGGAATGGVTAGAPGAAAGGLTGIAAAAGGSSRLGAGAGAFSAFLGARLR